MSMSTSKFIAAGTRVKISNPTSVPSWSTWDNDGGRTSTPVKKRLQQLFFKGDRRVTAEVVYVASESERDKLRANGRVKLQLRDPAGSMITITAPAENLRRG